LYDSALIFLLSVLLTFLFFAYVCIFLSFDYWFGNVFFRSLRLFLALVSPTMCSLLRSLRLFRFVYHVCSVCCFFSFQGPTFLFLCSACCLPGCVLFVSWIARMVLSSTIAAWLLVFFWD
jgi:hypothetical protein